MPNYKYINHTADLGIEVKGKNLKELFINMGKAIFTTQISGKATIRSEISFRIESESLEDLLVDWCRELLYCFSVKGFIPVSYNVSLVNFSVAARLKGDFFDAKRHKVKLEIKSPTYHNLSIKKHGGHYLATMILDV